MKINEFLNSTYVTRMDDGYSLGGSKGQVMSLVEILNDHKNMNIRINYRNGKITEKAKDSMPCFFRWTTGLHLTKEHDFERMFESYSGIFTIDIDSPKNSNGDKIWSVEYTSSIWDSMHRILTRTCKHLLFSELSFSHRGIHLIFGCTRDKWDIDSYCDFAGYCINVTYETLKSMNFSDNVICNENKLTSKSMLDGTCVQITRKYYYTYAPNYKLNFNFESEEEWSYVKSYKTITNTIESLRDSYKGNNEFIENDTLYDIKIKNKPSYAEIDDDYNSRVKLSATLIALCKRYSNPRQYALNVFEQIKDKIYNNLEYNRYEYVCNKVRDYIKTFSVENANVVNDVLEALKNVIDIEVFDPNVFLLDDNQYLSDVINDIPFEKGFNLLVSGTGTGKTECWKRMCRIDLLNPQVMKILVCEPYVSIIESKYEHNNNTHKAHGSVVIDEDYDCDLTVSNYNKILKINDEAASQLDYIVIDESHLLFAEPYRWDTTNKFMRKLFSLAKHTKIVFQTATPAYETSIFKISSKNVFKIKKRNTIKTRVHYMNSTKPVLANASAIAKKWLDNDMCDRVFIYNRSGGVIDDLMIDVNDYKTIVYHKKNADTVGIEYIDKNHKMGDYKILVSSCWFGVGHDLNDKDRCLVIVCGNLPYHEEVQAVGRFRCAQCIDLVVLCDEYNYHDNEYKSKMMLNNYFNKISSNNLFNSFVISKDKQGNIHDEFDALYAYDIWCYQHIQNSYLLKKQQYKRLQWQFFEPLTIKRTINECDGCQLLETLGISTVEIDNKTNIVRKTGEYKYKTKHHEKGESKYSVIGYKDIRKDNTIDNYFRYAPEIKHIKYKERLDMHQKLFETRKHYWNVIRDGEFTDDDYNYIDSNYPTLSKWAHRANGLFKYHRKIFDMMSDIVIVKYVENIYDCLNYIEMTNDKEPHDVIEHYIIKYIVDNMCEFNEENIDYALLYTIWCMYSNTADKYIKSDYLDGFRKLIRLCESVFILSNAWIRHFSLDVIRKYKNYDRNDFYEMFFEMCNLNENKQNMFNEIVTYGIDNVIKNYKLHKSRYYTVYDVKLRYNEAVKIFGDASSHTEETYDSVCDMLCDKITCEKRHCGNKKKTYIVQDTMPMKYQRKYNLKPGQEIVGLDAIKAGEKTKTKMRKNNWLVKK